MLLASAMLPKRRSSAHELDLERANTTLALKLLRANAALQLKTVYCERLLHQRLETIDALHGTIDQLRHQNQRLGLENDCLATPLVAPPVDGAMLAPK